MHTRSRQRLDICGSIVAILLLWTTLAVDAAMAQFTPPVRPQAADLSDARSKLPVTPTAWTIELAAGALVIDGVAGQEPVGIRESLEIPELARLTRVGAPDLGQRVVNVLLPYDAHLPTVDVSTQVTSSQDLGTYDVRPSGRPRSYDLDAGQWHSPLPPGITLDQEGKDMAIYDTNEFWPASPVRVLDSSRLGKFRIIRLLYSPYQWNPVTKQLRSLASTIDLTWERRDASPGVMLYELAHPGLFPDFGSLVNPSALAWYRLLTDLYRPVEYNYLIVTTASVQTNSTALDAFVSHKESLGFRVNTVSVEAIESLYSGTAERADKIRRFLKRAYYHWGVVYVLLIGDPDPYDASDPSGSVGSVPMKMMWVNGEGSSNGAYPTDFYYGDLTFDWDADGDGFSGELDDDGVPGYMTEVLVGRIPFDDVEKIDPVLSRTIDYHTNGAPPSSRKGAFLAGSFLDSETDSAYVMASIRSHVFFGTSISPTTFYQDDSTFVSTLELTDGIVPLRWQIEKPGLVIWEGHGNSSGTSVGYDGNWDGELMQSASADMPNPLHPTHVIQISCSTAVPEVSDNITHKLLEMQAVSSISASRVVYYLIGATSFGASPDISSIGYSCSQNHVAGWPVGRALSMTRYHLGGTRPWAIKNMLAYNLYGDPSLEYDY